MAQNPMGIRTQFSPAPGPCFQFHGEYSRGIINLQFLRSLVRSMVIVLKGEQIRNSRTYNESLIVCFHLCGKVGAHSQGQGPFINNGDVGFTDILLK